MREGFFEGVTRHTEYRLISSQFIRYVKIVDVRREVPITCCDSGYTILLILSPRHAFAIIQIIRVKLSYCVLKSDLLEL